MTETILITGSNRGIGLELVHQYAAQGWQVLACCRRPDQATALNQLGEQFPDIILHTLDVAQQDQVQKLAAHLQDCPIDILFNNAGIYGPNAEITVAESVGRMREILGTITSGNSGAFFDIDGSIIPW
jgi:NAD(P)-dependent dehydrogenase (short-subunit alcohol dehydrogenase family)